MLKFKNLTTALSLFRKKKQNLFNPILQNATSVLPALQAAMLFSAVEFLIPLITLILQ